MKFFSLRALARAVFPENYTCEICGVETFDSRLCPDCMKTVTFQRGATCPACGRKTVRAELCEECKAQPPLFRRAISPLVYENGGIILISKYKRGGCAHLKEYFAELICEKLAELPIPEAIVAVPVTKKVKFRRGYNQSELLARAIARRTGIPFLAGAVAKVKDTAAQKQLDRAGREKNLQGCFGVTDRAKIKGKRLLIVDDVLTTGATANELSRVLLKSGAAEVFVATVCSVENRRREKNEQ